MIAPLFFLFQRPTSSLEWISKGSLHATYLLNATLTTFLFPFSFSYSFPSDTMEQAYRMAKSLSTTYFSLVLFLYLLQFIGMYRNWNSPQYNAIILLFSILMGMLGIWMIGSMLYLDTLDIDSFHPQLSTVLRTRIKPLAYAALATQVIFLGSAWKLYSSRRQQRLSSFVMDEDHEDEEVIYEPPTPLEWEQPTPRREIMDRLPSPSPFPQSPQDRFVIATQKALQQKPSLKPSLPLIVPPTPSTSIVPLAAPTPLSLPPVSIPKPPLALIKQERPLLSLPAPTLSREDQLYDDMLQQVIQGNIPQAKEIAYKLTPPTKELDDLFTKPPKHLMTMLSLYFHR